MAAGPSPARRAVTLIRGHTATTIQTGKNAYGWKGDGKGFDQNTHTQICSKKHFSGGRKPCMITR